MNLGTQGLPSSQGAHVAIDNVLYIAYTYTFHIDINLNIRTPEKWLENMACFGMISPWICLYGLPVLFELIWTKLWFLHCHKTTRMLHTLYKEFHILFIFPILCHQFTFFSIFCYLMLCLEFMLRYALQHMNHVTICYGHILFVSFHSSGGSKEDKF